jgi:hypothetical protein
MTIVVRTTPAHLQTATVLSNSKFESLNPHGLYAYIGILQCCGLGSLQGFGTLQADTWNDKALLCQLLYQYFRTPGNLIYVLSHSYNQLDDPIHKLFVEVGAAIPLGEPFQNHNHPNEDRKLSLFRVEIPKLLGTKYLDKYGRAVPEPVEKKDEPKPASAKVPQAVPAARPVAA